MDTPVKKHITNIPITPKSKAECCIICSKVTIQIARYRLFSKSYNQDDVEKTELCKAVEKELNVVINCKTHFNVICRSCKDKISTISKKREQIRSQYLDTQKQTGSKYGFVYACKHLRASPQQEQSKKLPKTPLR